MRILTNYRVIVLCLCVASWCRTNDANAKELYGYIDRKGEWVIKPTYVSATPFKDGIATVELVDPESKMLIKKGIDRTGKFVAVPVPNFERDRVSNWKRFGSGPYPKRIFDKNGCLNTVTRYVRADGTVAINREFSQASYFSPTGTAFVQPTDNSPWEVINRSGKTIGVLSVDILLIGGWSEGLMNFSARVGKGSLMFGFLDDKGKVAVPPSFEYARAFQDGLAPVKSKGRWYYIDNKGNKIISLPENVSLAGEFQKGFAPVAVGGTPYKHQYYAAAHGAYWGFIDRKGKFITEPKYNVSEDNRVCPPDFSEGLTPMLLVEQGRCGFGFADYSGKLVIPTGFVHANRFSEGLAAVSTGDLEFSADDWKQAFDRSDFITKLFAKYKLMGMTKTEVHKLLGSPDSVQQVLSYASNFSISRRPSESPISPDDTFDVYRIHAGTCGHTSYWMLIEYKDDQVCRYRFDSIDAPGPWIMDNSAPYLDR